MNDKQLIINNLKEIDDSKNYEEILYDLYIQHEISKGVADMEEGRTMNTSQVKEIVNNW